jgi:adenosylmethionine-8-amino-7-oxononanoate aminotransferase
MTSRTLAELDRDHVFHPYTSIAEQQRSGPRLLASASGVWLRDEQGRELLDAMAGLWCVAAGYGRHEIADAMAEQARRLPYAHGFLGNANEPALRLAGRLAGLTPAGLDHFFFCNSGSEANDTIVKLVWYHWNLRGRPEKKKIIARHGAYHGVTLGATSLSGLPAMHALFDAPLPGFLHVRKPHFRAEALPGESEAAFSARLARELEEVIVQEGPETVAAFIGEPVMAAGGVVPPPEGYWPAVQEVLRRHDVVLAADEVVCGFGRLGTPFGSQRHAIEPDLLTLAKGLTSAYFPVSAVAVADRVWDVLAEGSERHGAFAHGHTTSLHPVGAAAALANLDVLENEGLLTRAAEIGPRFQQALRERFDGHPLVGEVRGEGLIAGVELEDPGQLRPLPAELRVGPRMVALCREEGLVTRALNATLAFCPPLVVTPEELDLIVERFGRALDRLADELPAAAHS